MKLAAVYARFSTDQQNPTSSADQIAMCRDYAERSGFQVVKTFNDDAKSGASIIGRPGLAEMMQAVAREEFDIVLVEAVDRLSRNQGDLHMLHDEFETWDVDLYTPHDGKVTHLMLTFRGMIGSEFLRDNAKKTHRGLAAVVKRGKYAGGRPYGYRANPANRGDLLIDENEAEVIRRIFKETAEGLSSRTIARNLNGDGIKPPRGDVWSPSSLHGSLQRGYGILHNQIYIGKIVWNKVRMKRVKSTNKRISRPNDPSQHIVNDAPHLRIVPQELWDACHVKARTSKPSLNGHRRPVRLLSGLLKCGSCGGGMAVKGADKSGKVRLYCSRHRNTGGCPDPQSYYLATVESKFFETILPFLRDPAAMQAMMDGFNDKLTEYQGQADSARAAKDREIDGLRQQYNNVADLIRSGGGNKAIAAELNSLLDKIETAEDELAHMPVLIPQARLDRDTIKELHDEFVSISKNPGQLPGNSAVGRVLREFVEEIVVERGEDREPSLIIRGSWAHFVSDNNALSVVGGIVGSGRRT